jgi:hypothetical protein
VSWFRKKKEDPTDPKIVEISMGGFLRQVIYDTLLVNSEGIAEIMGLPPISLEVEEMEEEASHRRLEELESIIPLIASHSDITAHAALASLVLQGIEPSEQIEQLVHVLSFSAAVSCVSTLKQLGLIEVGELHV